MTLPDSYLVQRLAGPRKTTNPGAVQAHHVFGGGRLGLSPQAWQALDQVCTVDYMGAAEYEGGVLPNALNEIIRLRSVITSFVLTLAPHERELNWSRKYPAKKGFPLPPAKTVQIFGFAPVTILDEVKDRVRLLCSPNPPRTKRDSLISQNLDPIEAVREPVLGWIELNNGFMFFSDRKMWEGFCTIFQLEMCAVPPLPGPTNHFAMSKKDLVTTAVSLGVFRNKSLANKMSKDLLAQTLNQSQS